MAIRTKINHRFKIDDIKLLISIGINEDELLAKQEVVVCLNIEPREFILGCISDKIEDTDCYDDIIRSIIILSQSRHFNLLEHFVHSLYQELTRKLENHYISISATKFPIIDNIKTSVTFQMDDHS